MYRFAAFLLFRKTRGRVKQKRRECAVATIEPQSGNGLERPQRTGRPEDEPRPRTGIHQATLFPLDEHDAPPAPKKLAPLAPLKSEAHVEALILEAARRRRLDRVRAARVTFRPFRSTLYSYRIEPDGTARVQLHTAFRTAPDAALAQLAQMILCRTKKARRELPRDAFDAFVRALPKGAFNLPGARRGAAKAIAGPGKHRSLDESFARVNETYFAGKMARPKLRWSPARARRILGTYREEADTLIVSQVFDSPKVPLWVLDYLMYHELLHKHLGVGRRTDGKRCMHGPEFKRLERKYARYKDAVVFLKKM